MGKKAVVKEVVDAPLYPDPFNPAEPVNPLVVDDAQKANIKAILNTACSDSRFAQKAYIAILKTLSGDVFVPVLESLSPDTAASGTATNPVIFTGLNFDPGAEVMQAGVPIGTVFVDETQLEANVNLSGAQAGVLAMSVRNSSGLTSNVVNFTVTEALNTLGVARKEDESKKEEKSLEVK